MARISWFFLGVSLLTACSSGERVARLERRVDSLAVTLTALVNARQGTSRPAAVESVTVAMAGAGSAGIASAPIVIVEFTDYQCPFCGRHFEQTLPELRRDYISTGKVRYVVRDLPLRQIHPHAARAAAASRCAGAQSSEQYWRYHDALFSRQKAISDTLFPRLAEQLGLDLPIYRACMTTPEPARLIDGDVAEAGRVGLSGTPAFVIGQPRGDGTVHGVLIRGAYPYLEFQKAIDAALGVSTARR
jgi:protein-disulfide isomerase